MMQKPIFDWSINLGHVLTFIGFLLTIALAFQALDKRVIVLEQATPYQAQRDSNQDVTTKELRYEIKETLHEVHNSLEKLSDKIDRKK